MKNIFDLDGKIAVVTGGAGLIGRAYVEGFASFGARVYIADNNSERAEIISREFKKRGFDIHVLVMDICDEISVKNGLDDILKKSKKVDVWVNNAYPRTKDWGLTFEKVLLESWRKNVDMHLNGYFLCCQKIAEQMKEQGRGSMINIASTYGIVGPDFSIYEGTSMTMPAAYSAIKGAVINFTKYLASYYGPSGVRVNCLSPGGVFDDQPKTFVDNYCRKTLLRRMAKPEDMVGAAVFLASDASSYITGHNLVVDGGWTSI